MSDKTLWSEMGGLELSIGERSRLGRIPLSEDISGTQLGALLGALLEALLAARTLGVGVGIRPRSALISLWTKSSLRRTDVGINRVRSISES